MPVSNKNNNNTKKGGAPDSKSKSKSSMVTKLRSEVKSVKPPANPAHVFDMATVEIHKLAKGDFALVSMIPGSQLGQVRVSGYAPITLDGGDEPLICSSIGAQMTSIAAENGWAAWVIAYACLKEFCTEKNLHQAVEALVAHVRLVITQQNFRGILDDGGFKLAQDADDAAFLGFTNRVVDYSSKHSTTHAQLLYDIIMDVFDPSTDDSTNLGTFVRGLRKNVYVINQKIGRNGGFGFEPQTEKITFGHLPLAAKNSTTALILADSTLVKSGFKMELPIVRPVDQTLQSALAFLRVAAPMKRADILGNPDYQPNN